MSNIKYVCCKLVSVKWSIASLMSSKLEPVIWLRVLVTLAYMKGRTYVRTYVVRTDVHDVMAIKPNGLPYFLKYGAPRARAELRYYTKHQPNEDDPCLKLRCYARESFFFFGKNLSSLQRSMLSWVPVLARQVTQKRDKRNFPRALQNHIDFTHSDHR